MSARKGFAPVLILVVVALTIIVLAVARYFQLKSKPSTSQTSPISETTPSHTTSSSQTDSIRTQTNSPSQSNENANWKTYTSTHYSFSYPPNLKINPNNSVELLEENGKLFLSIYSFDPAVVGISYCEAYSNDKPRCEQLKVGDKIAIIDWNVDGKTNAMLGNLSVTLSVTDNQAKKIFKQILSTFRFE